LLLLESILVNHGLNVITATNKNKAFTAIRTENPDLILLDIMLSPETDGYEICKLLKTEEGTQDIPVIFISSLDQAIDKVKAFQVGGVDYITKPFLTDEIVARVQTRIMQHQIQQQLAIQYEALQKEISRRRQAEDELKQTNRQLELLVTVDSLTGLNNRRHFNYHFEQEWKRMIREKAPLSLLLCDIDQFEVYNLNFGNNAGDLLLQDVARIVRKTAKRPGDIVAKWGEDEFIMLLPRTDQQGASTLAEQIRRKIAELSANNPFQRKRNAGITLSMGIADALPTYGIQKEMLLLNATESLSMAKTSGDSVICHETAQ
jgi:diguanylate cyclase (GGDEF)-like protein